MMRRVAREFSNITNVIEEEADGAALNAAANLLNKRQPHLCSETQFGAPVSINMGLIVQKGLTLKRGQTHVKRYLEPLTKLIQDRKVDMTSIISHRSTKLEDGPDLYKLFKDKADGCTKVVFHPAG